MRGRLVGARLGAASGSAARSERLATQLVDALATEPKHVDVLVATAGADTGAVLTALTDLEMRGVVQQRPGMVFGLT